jgi:hypothetical protein
MSKTPIIDADQFEVDSEKRNKKNMMTIIIMMTKEGQQEGKHWRKREGIILIEFYQVISLL